MKKIVEYLKGVGIKRYTIFELDKPFPFYLLDVNKLKIMLLYYDSSFKYVTIEFWDPSYNVVFYDEKERYVTNRETGFIEEKSAIEYFNNLLLDISQLKGGEHNG